MSVLERVANVFAAVFVVPAESVTIDTIPDDVPKWDSLGHMAMVAALETEFGVQFELDEVMEMATVSKIVEIVTAKGA